jgi:pimeloyl-ACP methyl ester carboxylesterase
MSLTCAAEIELFAQKFVHRVHMHDHVRIHYVIGGRAPGQAPPMLLIHGFPQNWWAWHRVMLPLAEHYTLVVPDLRGIGLSDKPESGYTKRQLAADLFGLIEALRCGPAHIVGHDVGAMVAYAYASQFPARSLCVLDIPLPGIGDWDRIITGPGLWQFGFHQKRDLAEALICGGREGTYIRAFVHDKAHNPAVFTDQDMGEYIQAHSYPGAFRAAMEMFRQFPQDALDNLSAGRLPADLEVLALGGDKRWGPLIVNHLQSVCDRVRGGSLQDCGHFLADEQPEQLVRALHDFCS